MTRFFVQPSRIDGNTVTLNAEDALHLDRVLRAKAGDEIGVLDGSGKLYLARLVSLSKSQAVAEITATEEPGAEPTCLVTIAQSLPKTAEKLEWVLQHGVEIGAAGFWVFRSHRSEAGKLAERPDRWAKIVKTAAEQSGRTKLPPVRALRDLDDVFAEGQKGGFDLILFCDEAEQAQLLKAVLDSSNAQKILLVIGPEGGWSDDERQVASRYGASSVSLGPRILRTETAALTALSQILYALDAVQPGR